VTAACTIVTRSYVAQARVLAESYLRHHPRARFYALVVDGLPAGVDAGSGIEPMEPDALALPYFRELAFKYDATELATALKPTFLARLLERERTVVYLDPDVLVLRPFTELRRTLTRAGIVLTPHTLSPWPDDRLRPSEPGMLATGVYNLGFLALRRSQDAAALLAWWEQRLRDGSRADLAGGSFTDQKWVELVPAYFGSTAILRDPAYNVAYWNLHERPLDRVGGVLRAGGRPVACFHFSGFDPREPGVLTRRVPRRELTRTRVKPATPLAELLDEYALLLARHGFEECSRWEYGFARFADGAPVEPAVRRRYGDLPVEERARIGDPFAPDEATRLPEATA
jgi:hypothetical protein